MGSVTRITLDAETFKALASPTRLTVLRALDERRKTLTEISRDLSLNKATVHEHLGLLAAADLVRKRDDEGRKWIYYELTWRGQKLLHPQETTTFNVLLGLGIAAAGGGMGMLARSLYVALEPRVEAPLLAAPAPSDDASRARSVADPSAESVATTAQTASSTAAPAASGGSGTSTGTSSAPSSTHSSAPPTSTGTSDSSAYGAGGSAMHDAATTTPTTHAELAASGAHPGLDDTGWLGLALLGFAALMALLAWLLRHHLRADPFRPPSEPEQ
ncbi:MAG: hypothetical protein QOI63_1005 [Thermoplasmata archaeon]|jgi:DNA-binding transcriptional ArsR family regulator|nr:hypothetical protein [Thermoplasmata archaeon]